MRGASAVGIGTATGHGIILASTPWLASIYTPAEFGYLALLTSISNGAVSAACGRYDLALPAASKGEVPPLYQTAISVAVLFSLLSLFTFWLIDFAFSPSWFEKQSILLVSTCILLVGIQQATIGVFTHDRRYSGIGLIRFAQGTGFVALASFTQVGLLAAHCFSFIWTLPAALRYLAKWWSPRASMVNAAKKHRDFPTLGLPGALLDVLGYSSCIWVVTYFYGATDTGHYSQIQRIIGAPMMLLAISFGQVLLRTNADHINNPDEIRKLLHKVLLIMTLIGATVIFAVALSGETMLQWILGPEWRTESSFTVPIAFAVCARACISPLSIVFITLRRFHTVLKWQTTYFCSSILLLSLIAANFKISFFVIAYAVHEALLYSLYYFLIRKTIRQLPCAPSSV